MARKSMLALGVLGAFGASAQAQSSVQVYGIIDAGVGAVTKTATSNDRLYRTNADASTSSRFGLRGTEDLGKGLSAFFGMESGLDPRNGNAQGTASSGTINGAAAPASFWRRGAYVGLRSTTLGAVTIGRFGVPGVGISVANNNMITTGFNSGLGATLAAVGIGNDFWNNNQIRYDSPKFGNFDFAGNISFGETAGSLRSGSNAGVTARYSMQPLVFTAAYQRDEDWRPTGAHVSWYWLSGTYIKGPFRASVGYIDVNNDRNIAGWFDSTQWTVGARYDFTPQLSLSGHYFGLDDKRAGGTKTTLTVVNLAYALSKRTSLYAVYGHADSGTIGVTPIWGAAANAQTTVRNAVNQGLTAGLLHTF
ncbi:porin [Aquabacterium sp. J223]|uniref:porin n=1 Tax=Aquabacterium sp. J223 TaxID=2898431 RepID=UPI0021AD6849|nr:porin [Aquabacterium sp. J223]UUX97322.1 porin [Aquabacterium sp. J223]